MPVQLLSTKFFIPSLRAEHIFRQRLASYFDTCLSHKLTLVSAPAGYGKTTLLSEWAKACPYPLAWLSLDEGDNDPARFQEYLFAAFRHHGVISSSLLPEPADLHESIAALINIFSTISSPVILVLDDYHVLTNQSIHEALAAMLERQPEHLHIIIASRADPPLPLARLRGRGQMIEIRLADLRFTEEETIQFLHKFHGLQIADNEALTLAERTEGWAAGLQMAAVALHSLQQSGNPEQIRNFVQDFSGSNRFILDYLMEEVLARTPSTIRSFLYQTAILDRFTANLCAEVMAEPILLPELCEPCSYPMDSARCRLILEQIEQSNLFIIPLDPDRLWYRYHSLFAGLLRKRLEELAPAAIPELHRRASSWFEHQGFLEPAIEHALAARDYLHAASLIEKAVNALFLRGELVSFSRWARSLPEDVLHLHPLLTVYYCYTLIMNGSPEEAVEFHLQQAERNSPDRGTSAAVLVLRSFLLSMRGETQASIEMTRRAMKNLPQELELFQNYGRVIMAIPYLWSGRSEEAVTIFEQALASGRNRTSLLFTPLLMRRLARIYMALGQLQKAGQYLDQALRLAADPQGQFLPHAGMLLITRGNLFREWNELDAAERDIRKGLELLSQWGKTRLADGYASLAEIYQARGGWEAAREMMRLAIEHARRTEDYEYDDIRAACLQARLWIRQGNLAEAQEWAFTAELEDDPGPAARLSGDQPLPNRLRNYMRREEYPVLARLRLAQGRADQALQILEELLSIFRNESWITTLLEVEILRAMAFDAIGDRASCFQSLQEALEIALPGGFIRTFLDEGSRMKRLLQAFIESSERKSHLLPYIQSLLAAFPVHEDNPEVSQESQSSSTSTPIVDSIHPEAFAGPAVSAKPAILEEPLSERELEVLRLLSTYLTIPEIAGQLVIAPSTVRSHVKNIYGKLGVHARNKAVERARRLNLLK